ncbi:hypothetical protein J7E96_01200 [Streptomyces sp. ISL-96]|uniref:hypothetical protein n=1 Tax=Streptomyces sp. ISL-96 TaxID=2819191 RepID=UPI001BEC682B|nr:hypothetical protein [Streptomyces sp. ISL-96]MBT2487177.1 hypothetical protein [Streptomyces sp. ISL-96]
MNSDDLDNTVSDAPTTRMQRIARSRGARITRAAAGGAGRLVIAVLKAAATPATPEQVTADAIASIAKDVSSIEDILNSLSGRRQSEASEEFGDSLHTVASDLARIVMDLERFAAEDDDL